MIDRASPLPPENGAPRLRGWHTYASLALALAILAVMVSAVDLREVWRHVSECNKTWVLAGLLAHYSTYPLRGLRWRYCLRHLDVQAGVGSLGLLVFFYNFIDNVVPAKLGDVYGAHLARLNLGVRRSAALGSILFQRMIDAWVVLVLAAGASWTLFSGALPDAVVWALWGGLALAVVVTAILGAFIVFRNSLPAWVPGFLAERVQAFHHGMLPAPAQILPIAVLTLAIWALETLWIFLLALAFGQALGPVEIVFLTMVPLLASAFPLTPSGAGVVELTLFGSLRLLGAPAALAASFTFLNRAIDYWLHIALGVLVFGLRGRLGMRTWLAAEPDVAATTRVVRTQGGARELRRESLAPPARGGSLKS
jgi:uncharacterized membrane protein YbhN (UPF0104 family)